MQLLPTSAAILVALCSAASLAQTSPALPAPSSRSLYDTPAAANPSTTSLLTQPTLTPGAILLIDLERQFAADTAKGGGKAFAAWFADDAVALSNGKPAILGRGAIAAGANWDPAVYQLTWTPTAAQMGPSNDMGYTWGHYEGRSKDANGNPVLVFGRYITIWKRLPDGHWRVVLDASADDPPAAGDCCALPKP